MVVSGDIRSQVFVTILLFLSVVWVYSLDTTRGIALSDFDTNAVSTCSGQGFDYFDSSSFTCKNCPSNQEPDDSSTDGIGNYVSCKCKSGFKKVAHSCAGVSVFSTFLPYFILTHLGRIILELVNHSHVPHVYRPVSLLIVMDQVVLHAVIPLLQV